MPPNWPRIPNFVAVFRQRLATIGWFEPYSARHYENITRETACKLRIKGSRTLSKYGEYGSRSRREDEKSCNLDCKAKIFRKVLSSMKFAFQCARTHKGLTIYGQMTKGMVLECSRGGNQA